MRTGRLRKGMTLVELIVVVAIMGVIGAMAVLSMPAAPTVRVDDAATKLLDLRRQALRSGAPIPMRVILGGSAHEVVAMPDGSMIGDSGVTVNRLTARWKVAR